MKPPLGGQTWTQPWVTVESDMSPVLEKLTVSHQTACWEHALTEAALGYGKVILAAGRKIISAEGDGDLGQSQAWIGGRIRGILMTEWMRMRRENRESRQGPSGLESRAHLRCLAGGEAKLEVAGSGGVRCKCPTGHWTNGSELGLWFQSGQHCVVTETIW